MYAQLSKIVHSSAVLLTMSRLGASAGDGHAGHGFYRPLRPSRVDVVCERENKNTKSTTVSLDSHHTTSLSLSLPLPLPRASGVRRRRFPAFRVFASRRSIEPDVLPA